MDRALTLATDTGTKDYADRSLRTLHQPVIVASLVMICALCLTVWDTVNPAWPWSYLYMACCMLFPARMSWNGFCYVFVAVSFTWSFLVSI